MKKYFTLPAPKGYSRNLIVKATDDGGYFSVTGEIGQGISGCIHTEILSAMPSIRPLVDLHLSDSKTGFPMHAEANGWYWLAGAHGGLCEKFHGGSEPDGKTPEKCLEILSEHVRLPLENVRSELIPITNRNDWKSWVEAQRLRWKSESDAGRELLASL